MSELILTKVLKTEVNRKWLHTYIHNANITADDTLIKLEKEKLIREVNALNFAQTLKRTKQVTQKKATFAGGNQKIW